MTTGTTTGADFGFDIAEHPRLGYEIADPAMGIGTLCMNDLIDNPMGVMLQGKVAELEILRLRARLAALEAPASAL